MRKLTGKRRKKRGGRKGKKFQKPLDKVGVSE